MVKIIPLLAIFEEYSISYSKLKSCLGVDVRKMIHDGISKRGNVFGVDLLEGFFHAGYHLFGDKEEMSDSFLKCDILETEECKAVLQKTKKEEGFDILYLGSVFHLFSKEKCILIARNMREMLKKGGFFFGRTAGSQFEHDMENPPHEQLEYLFSVDNLRKMLEENGFENVQIEVTEIDSSGENEKEYKMFCFSCQKC